MNINRIKKNIKKVEEIVENIDVQDVINRMEIDRENSIEEDIERLKLCSNNQCNICGRYEKEECMLERNRCEQHILSAYQEVLKENEILKEEKAQAWEEWNNLEQGSYETEQRLKRENEQLRTEVNSLKEDNERYQELELQILESEE